MHGILYSNNFLKSVDFVDSTNLLLHDSIFKDHWILRIIIRVEWIFQGLNFHGLHVICKT